MGTLQMTLQKKKIIRRYYEQLIVLQQIRQPR